MLKTQLQERIRKAILAAQDAGEITFTTLPEIIVERPEQVSHGDYATGIALKLARAVRMNPLQLAHIIVRHLGDMPEIDSISIPPPGFINFTVKASWLQRLVELILEDPLAYGTSDLGRGIRVQIEFVSANPTGPLHVGHGRGAVLGSTLANVLSAAGYSVEREYYLNDIGNQIRTFGRSVYVRYRQALGDDYEMPPDGYMGEYVHDLAQSIIETHGDQFARMNEEEGTQAIGKLATSMMVDAIKEDLTALNVEFDCWFSEGSLHESGEYEQVMALLRNDGYITEREGAVWFESSLLGDDKDAVLVRSDGSPTYFASDVAYHYDKLVRRGFDWVIDIWGADHQGHIPRMKAVVKAFGEDPDKLTVLTCQLVNLRRGKDVVKASKRSGDVVTLRELVTEVGPDACRYNFLSRSADSQMDFDIELAKRQSADNPVYYVQYAHARIASILRGAAERGIVQEEGDVYLLQHESEMQLLRILSKFPEAIDTAARTLQPHYLPYYAQELATAFHAFYKQCRVLTEDKPLTQARLRLVLATKAVLVRTLDLMGISAPEQM
ncbi:MAG TPA: arginine--tRNA ligase [Dehalococcoidia bacterium]|nr:arginine--tRNA ligase [Dehalococcoidia bacterium]